MIQKIVMSLLGTIVFFAFLSNINANPNVKTFLPPNTLHLEDNVNAIGGITEKDFNTIIDQLQLKYAPIVQHLGGYLVFNKYWSNSTVNASANQSGKTWYVNMYGGLARRSEITPDGFAMVICHELGHHLAGFPKVQYWAANEGQSDYYATLACGKYIWQDEDNSAYEEMIDTDSKELCDEKYSLKDDQLLCYRQMLGSFSMAKLLAVLGGTPIISINTPDTTKVSRTKNEHPKAQCRLDTYVAGILCDIDWNLYFIPQSEKESSNYTCVRSKGFDKEARPRCWFKPRL